MKDYGQIVTTLKSSPWLITEGGLETILQIVDQHLTGNVSLEEIRQRSKEGERDRPAIKRTEGDIGILPLHGPIFPKANMMTMMSGATSLEQWQEDFRTLMNNDRVGTILLDIDSPGGSAFMVTETAKMIRQAREVKPVYAVANTMAASAAMNLASQATKLYVTDSGYVGSVGAFMVHTDDSEMLAKAGVKQTIIKAGRFKAANLMPLTADTLEYLSDKVRESVESFVSDVAAGRGTTVQDVLENYGEGGLVGAKQALEVGMVDGVHTFNDVLTQLLDGGGNLIEPATKGKAIAAGSFMQHSLDKEKEHSEPGTGAGGEPEPRIPPEDEQIDEWKKGERLQKPPGILESEEMVMNREQLLVYAERLGISNAAELTDEELTTKVTDGLNNTLDKAAELDAALAQGTQQLEFAKQFPEQAAQLQRLQQESQATDAKLFASEFDRIGDTNKGLSVLAKGEVEEAHLKLSADSFTADDLRGLVQTVAAGVVPFGEIGSARQEENEDVVNPSASARETRQQFSDKVQEIMEEDKLDRKAAIEQAAQKYPKLAEAYQRS